MEGLTIGRMIAGILGNLFSLFIFISPASTFVDLHKSKNVGSCRYTPHLVIMANSALWVIYGLPAVHKDNLYVIPANATGIFLNLVYLGVYFFHAPLSEKVRVAAALCVEIVLVAAVATSTFVFFHTLHSRTEFTGVFLCIIMIVRIVFYAAPLTDMVKVIRTKSIESLSFTRSLALFLSCASWFCYASFRQDVFSMVGNGVGTLAGASQVFLYVWFY